jgi:sugar phosphate isomerase/epimerase
MDKLVKAFSMACERAEEYDVDLVLAQMPWNYTNTTGNFRRVAEAVDSPRLKVMWGPSDNYNSGEYDVATAGFNNVRPYISCLHIKDLRVNDGLSLDFDYMPFGEGDVDYRTVFRNLRDHRVDAVLSISTHFTPPSGSAVEAVRINYANVMSLIDRLENGR